MIDHGGRFFAVENLPQGNIVFATVAVINPATRTFGLASFGDKISGEVLPPVEDVLKMYGEAAALRWGYKRASVSVFSMLNAGGTFGAV